MILAARWGGLFRLLKSVTKEADKVYSCGSELKMNKVFLFPAGALHWYNQTLIFPMYFPLRYPATLYKALTCFDLSPMTSPHMNHPRHVFAFKNRLWNFCYQSTTLWDFISMNEMSLQLTRDAQQCITHVWVCVIAAETRWYVCNKPNPSSFMFELAGLHFQTRAPLIHTSESLDECHS